MFNMFGRSQDPIVIPSAHPHDDEPLIVEQGVKTTVPGATFTVDSIAPAPASPMPIPINFLREPEEKDTSPAEVMPEPIVETESESTPEVMPNEVTPDFEEKEIEEPENSMEEVVEIVTPQENEPVVEIVPAEKPTFEEVLEMAKEEFPVKAQAAVSQPEEATEELPEPIIEPPMEATRETRASSESVIPEGAFPVDVTQQVKDVLTRELQEDENQVKSVEDAIFSLDEQISGLNERRRQLDEELNATRETKAGRHLELSEKRELLARRREIAEDALKKLEGLSR